MPNAIFRPSETAPSLPFRRASPHAGATNLVTACDPRAACIPGHSLNAAAGFFVAAAAMYQSATQKPKGILQFPVCLWWRGHVARRTRLPHFCTIVINVLPSQARVCARPIGGLSRNQAVGTPFLNEDVRLATLINRVPRRSVIACRGKPDHSVHAEGKRRLRRAHAGRVRPDYRRPFHGPVAPPQRSQMQRPTRP
jgi:hypothetical protein